MQPKNRMWRTGLTLLLLSGITACASGPTRTSAQEQADREIAASVAAALDADKLLYARHITVRANGGVVRLTGFVWDNSDLSEAERVAELVPGVTRVINDVELERNSNDNNGVTR